MFVRRFILSSLVILANLIPMLDGASQDPAKKPITPATNDDIDDDDDDYGYETFAKGHPTAVVKRYRAQRPLGELPPDQICITTRNKKFKSLDPKVTCPADMDAVDAAARALKAKEEQQQKASDAEQKAIERKAKADAVAAKRKASPTIGPPADQTPTVSSSISTASDIAGLIKK